MSDPAKLIGRAEKLLEKGKPELALEEYRAAIELQPENEHLLQKTADLALSIKQLGPASDMLRRLFGLFVARKQISDAAVVFRKLQRMKVLDPEMVSRYAELCVSTHRKDAAEAYRVAFQEFQRLGDPRRALQCITRSLELDPRMEDYREQARISEALHEPVLAAVALVQLGVMLERAGQNATEAYERAYANNPANMAARLGHGRGLIANGRRQRRLNCCSRLLLILPARKRLANPTRLPCWRWGAWKRLSPLHGDYSSAILAEISRPFIPSS